MQNRMALYCLGLLAVLSSNAGLSSADEASDIPDNHIPMTLEAVQTLSQGGYVIYFRHAATNHETVDTDRQNLENCATQRNLSDLGRAQAEAIGAAFDLLDIPVGDVLSSPYCRCMDTARLAFGRVTASQDLLFALDTGAERTAELAEALRNMLSEQPAPGTNTVIAGHTVNMMEAAGFWPKPEGAALILKPDGAGDFDLIGTVMPDEWLEFAGALAQ